MIYGLIIEKILKVSNISIKHTDKEVILSLDDRMIILERGRLLPKSMTYYEQNNEEYIVIHYLFEINSVEDIQV